MPVVELAEEGNCKVAVALEDDMVVARCPTQQVLVLCDGCSAISVVLDTL